MVANKGFSKHRLIAGSFFSRWATAMPWGNSVGVPVHFADIKFWVLLQHGALLENSCWELYIAIGAARRHASTLDSGLCMASVGSYLQPNKPINCTHQIRPCPTFHHKLDLGRQEALASSNPSVTWHFLCVVFVCAIQS